MSHATHAPHQGFARACATFASLRRLRVALAALSIAALSSAATAQEPRAFPELGMKIVPPPLEKLAFDEETTEQVQGMWTGTLAGAQVRVVVFHLPGGTFRFEEPDEVRDLVLDNLRRDHADYAWDEFKLIAGSYGRMPYSSFSRGPSYNRRKQVDGEQLVLCGALESGGWSIDVHCVPASPQAREALTAWLAKGITLEGKARDWKWTDKEAEERWLRDAPEKLHKKFEKPIRTAHYIVLTNVKDASTFAKKMEECYVAIRKIYPFDELQGRRLMPVFLFRTPDEYYDYYVKVAHTTREDAAKSKGHAWRDYYATWYEAPNDPVHIHEAVHQIFANRLQLKGGGSWFQEGVAEYVSSTKNDLNAAASLVKKGRHVPLATFVRTPSLLGSAQDDVSGESAAANQYAQAALFIEFLHDAKWAAPKFQALVHAIGLAPDNDAAKIEACFRQVYGLGLTEIEAKWLEYCKKR